MSNSTNLVPDPSTFRQVLKNMNALDTALKDISSIQNTITTIQNTIEQAGDTNDERYEEINDALKALGDKLTALNVTVTNIQNVVTKPTGPSDIITTNNGVKVIGIHVNTSDAEKNTPISEYEQGVTWEFKNTSVIGVSKLTGMSGNYCTVMTVKQDSLLPGEKAVSITPYQVAYSTEGMYFYRRYANANGTWGDWEPQDLGDDFRYQIVESVIQPTDQLAGEYWMQPLDNAAYIAEIISVQAENPTATIADGVLDVDERNDDDFSSEDI